MKIKFRPFLSVIHRWDKISYLPHRKWNKYTFTLIYISEEVFPNIIQCSQPSFFEPQKVIIMSFV